MGGLDLSCLTRFFRERNKVYKNIQNMKLVIWWTTHTFSQAIRSDSGRTEAGREEVIEAAKKARCYDFIMALSDGFETMVGEGVESLSGGEKQWISTARRILKDAPIV